MGLPGQQLLKATRRVWREFIIQTFKIKRRGVYNTWMFTINNRPATVLKNQTN
jgi:hypothetical protein